MTPSPPINMIIARAQNGAIGKDGSMPWHLPADLKRFKALTMGGALIMGRKTFESLPGVLPGRRHVVLTRDPHWQGRGAEVAHDPEEALARAQGEPIWVIGGAEIFALYLPHAERIELTEILCSPEADTFLPDPRAAPGWREVACEEHPPEGTRPGYRFVTLARG
ncbi:dihydrofolate reductase [Sphingomicrobium astaxanthinifaciens]|uniref:dihydrofolate reductase n=1 Tax=Sphingomicrobium astaxanthinifaciens TaxID=1227949 RepID=UPI001FCAFF71|nr:dihydrofolate reductase [Sphingomicrobium astaxanthinifaciens]MCJ7421735.1 dihydrofolate reductase [Sphingomicrobium astaxanthinifaciens]